MKRGLTLIALLALALPSGAEAAKQRSVLMPGVTYTKEVRWVRGGPLVTHVINAPRPGGLWALKPVLSNETVLRNERVTSMQRRYSGGATLAGVNGDYFSVDTGRPSGIVLRDGVLATRPRGSRSSLGIAFNGSLRVARLRYFGRWQVDGFAAHPLNEFNQPLTTAKGVALYTPLWGGPTPSAPDRLDLVLDGFPPAVANGNRRGRAVRLRARGGTLIPAGGAVLQARGVSRNTLRAEALPGRVLTLHFSIPDLWPDVADAIGGGPVLVQNGRAVLKAGEEFTRAQLAPRHPRTAVGQLANGRVILVAVDGRSGASRGLRNWELALEMVRLGAVTAMGLDAGGSTTLAFDGRVLNRPSDGAERSVADGLFVFFYGAYAPKPRLPVFSPNGDGVADVQRVSVKVVRRSQVNVRLLRPDGSLGWQRAGWMNPQRLALRLSARGMQNGRWRWLVESVDPEGRQSQMARSFVVNKTLGHLRLSKQRMRVAPRIGGRLGVSVVLTRASRFRVTVRRAGGAVVRRLRWRSLQPRGRIFMRWDGRNANRLVVQGGTYVIRAEARNALGTVSLRRGVTVIR